MRDKCCNRLAHDSGARHRRTPPVGACCLPRPKQPQSEPRRKSPANTRRMPASFNLNARAAKLQGSRQGVNVLRRLTAGAFAPSRSVAGCPHPADFRWSRAGTFRWERSRTTSEPEICPQRPMIRSRGTIPRRCCDANRRRRRDNSCGRTCGRRHRTYTAGGRPGCHQAVCRPRCTGASELSPDVQTRNMQAPLQPTVGGVEMHLRTRGIRTQRAIRV